MASLGINFRFQKFLKEIFNFIEFIGGIGDRQGVGEVRPCLYVFGVDRFLVHLAPPWCVSGFSLPGKAAAVHFAIIPGLAQK